METTESGSNWHAKTAGALMAIHVEHDTFEFVESGRLRPSALNPRDNLGDLTSLKESIAAQGILQPLLVRAVDAAPGALEIVCGHRRFAAATKLGLEYLPVVIRDLSDQEALEAQVAENSEANRLNIHPLREADAFRRLHEEHRLAVAEIAKKVGRTSTYVYARMLLCDLQASARQAFASGKIPVSTALLIARIPVQSLQERAVKEIVGGAKVLTFEEARDLVQSSYMLRLALAPFGTADALLDPKAGACAPCPKKTGNQKELFADVKGGDVCTDPTCFKRKADLAWDLVVQEANAKGWKVMPVAEAKRLYPRASSTLSDSGWVDLDLSCSEDPKRRTWGQLVGKRECARHVCRNHVTGVVTHVAKRGEAIAAALENGHKFLEDEKPNRTKPQLTQAVEIRREVVNLVVANVVGEPHPWAAIAQVLAEAKPDAAERVCRRRGIEAKKKGQSVKALMAFVAADAKQARGVAIELSLPPVVFDVWAGLPSALKVLADGADLDLRDEQEEAKKLVLARTKAQAAAKEEARAKMAEARKRATKK